MELYELPKDIQEKILKLASEHAITINETKHYYLMGGDHADHLCRLASVGVPYYIIEMENNALWKKKNDKWKEELEKLSI